MAPGEAEKVQRKLTAYWMSGRVMHAGHTPHERAAQFEVHDPVDAALLRRLDHLVEPLRLLAPAVGRGALARLSLVALERRLDVRLLREHDGLEVAVAPQLYPDEDVGRLVIAMSPIRIFLEYSRLMFLYTSIAERWKPARMSSAKTPTVMRWPGRL